MKKIKQKRIKVEVTNDGFHRYYPQYKNKHTILTNIYFIVLDLIFILPELLATSITKVNVIFGFYRKFKVKRFENYETTREKIGFFGSINQKVVFLNYESAVRYLDEQTEIEKLEIKNIEENKKAEYNKKVKQKYYVSYNEKTEAK